MMADLLLYIFILAFILFVPLSIYFYKKQHDRKYLVFSSVGDINNVSSWAQGRLKRKFDVVIYYYGDDPAPVFEADLVVKRKGLKLDNFYHYLDRHDVSKYHAVWLVDDDIIMDTDSINEMFDTFTEYNLYLAQPSYSSHSLAPWGISHNNPDCVLRYTNFVEVGVPLFSAKVLPVLCESFNNSGTGFGLDYIWPSLLGFPEDRIAVIDRVQCCHPDDGYSALDELMPRSMHLTEGVELLVKYRLLDEGWQSTESNPWPNPYTPREYLRILKNHAS